MPEIRMIPVDLIDPHPHNPRRDLGDLTELRRRHAALTPFALRFLSNGPGGEPFIALACEDGTPLPEPAFDAVLLFAELAAVELPALLDAAAEHAALTAERDALAAKLERVRALHYAADNDAARTPICETCHGKAGVHECGCWADHDREPVCGHCREGHKDMSVTWPCPTIRALDADA